FNEGVLFSIVGFFESTLLQEDFSLNEKLQCETFMDSGAFAAETMNFSLDPYEVAELHATLEADLIVPLDQIIFPEDSDKIIKQKVEETIKNTEILLDYRPKKSEVIGPLQGHSLDVIKEMFEKYRELGIQKFAIGGLASPFQSDLTMALDIIKTARNITKGFFLHVFGRFLHPRLLKLVIETGADSVDGFGYILSSVRGFYTLEGRYEVIGNITEDQLKSCSCPACQENSLQDFQRGDEEAQYLLIIHNIHSLIQLKEHYLRTINQKNRE
uniref:tRNA-guanine transglycosylase n=1 Tax=Candidatus Borrarchaeum sp. TaxID=2846742 RepID=UPI00257EF96D